MKPIAIIYIFLSLLVALPATAKDEKSKTQEVTFKVKGVCHMCKARIENAALTKGVKSASWDKDRQQIDLVFIPKKTDQLTIEKEIAKTGHDTENVNASDEAYDKLHDCCKYREGQAVH